MPRTPGRKAAGRWRDPSQVWGADTAGAVAFALPLDGCVPRAYPFLGPTRLPRRPLPWVALVFACGVGVADGVCLSPWVWGCLGTAALFGLTLSGARSHAPLLLGVGVFLAGMARGASVPTADELEAPLAPWFDRTVSLHGRVRGVVERTARGVRFELETRHLHDAEGWYDVHARVLVHAPEHTPDLAVARSVVVHGKPRPLRWLGNPGTRNGAAMLHGRGIAATLTLFDPVWLEVVERDPVEPRGYVPIDRIRARAMATIEEALPERHAAVVAALLLGLRGGLPGDLIESFARTGTSHLLAISGLHVGLVGVVTFGWLRLLLVRIPVLAEHGWAERIAALGAVVPVALYVLL